MGNIERRLVRLEKQSGKSTCFIVIHPGETEDQAKERYFSEFPERRSARLIFFVIKGRLGVGSYQPSQNGNKE